MAESPDPLVEFTGFDWDAGSAEKNWKGHGVSQGECEQAFFSRPLVVAPGATHSSAEPRYYLLGQTLAGRPLLVVFTRRGDRIRVISAREMNRRERSVYAHAQEEP
jgi:uncharacterized DUF497 family protein